MQASPHVLYDELINQVIEDSHSSFDREGIDTHVLAELKKLWKEKLLAYGAGHVDTGAAAGGYGLGGLPLFDPAPSMGRPEIKQEWGMQSLPPVNMNGAAGHAYTHTLAPGVRMKAGIPQTDGAVGEEQEAGGGREGGEETEGRRGVASGDAPRRPRKGDMVSISVDTRSGAQGGGVICIEQVDGAGSGPVKKRKTGVDSYDDDDDDLDGDDDEEELGSDDDEDEEELDTDNLVLCQYDKVSRTKTKWKATLHSGLVHLNLVGGGTREIVFKKATGDMNFQRT